MAQLWEIENFLDIRNEQLHIDGVNATDLAHERGTPLFVYSEKRIRHNIERLRKGTENRFGKSETTDASNVLPGSGEDGAEPPRPQ